MSWQYQKRYKYSKRAIFLTGFGFIDFYLSVLSDNESIYLKTESPYAFTEDMSDEVANAFKKQSLTKGCAVFLE